VGAPGGDHDVGLDVLALDDRVDVAVELADVDRRLARVADLGIDVHHARRVALVVEVLLRADVLPARGDRVLEERPEREAEPGERERHRRDAAGRQRGPLHQPAARDGLALERAGNPASVGVAGLLVELLG
jgi:hypothetical protein